MSNDEKKKTSIAFFPDTEPSEEDLAFWRGHGGDPFDFPLPLLRGFSLLKIARESSAPAPARRPDIPNVYIDYIFKLDWRIVTYSATENAFLPIKKDYNSDGSCLYMFNTYEPDKFMNAKNFRDDFSGFIYAVLNCRESTLRLVEITGFGVKVTNHSKKYAQDTEKLNILLYLESLKSKGSTYNIWSNIFDKCFSILDLQEPVGPNKYFFGVEKVENLQKLTFGSFGFQDGLDVDLLHYVYKFWNKNTKGIVPPCDSIIYDLYNSVYIPKRYPRKHLDGNLEFFNNNNGFGSYENDTNVILTVGGIDVNVGFVINKTSNGLPRQLHIMLGEYTWRKFTGQPEVNDRFRDRVYGQFTSPWVRGTNYELIDGNVVLLN
jgi:hypothetical protein